MLTREAALPVEFLTIAQEKCYGRYADEPTPTQLERYFYLDDRERQLVNRRRGAHNRLGFALQLCTVRFLGTFLVNPTDVPPGVVNYLAQQLEIKDIQCLSHYLERTTTHREHAGEIQRLYGYRDFHDPPEYWRLVRWLYQRAWLSAERPSVLFDLTTARLVERKILLPGVTTLTRLIARIRERANQRLEQALFRLAHPQQRVKLEKLLVVGENSRQTPFEQLRKSPTRISASGLVAALQRLVSIRALGLNELNFTKIPTARLQLLARTAAGSKAQAIARMPEPRRIATLLAFAYVWQVVAMDDAIDLLDSLVRELLAFSQRRGIKERLRTLKDLDAAALLLSAACQVLLDPDYSDPVVRPTVFDLFDPEELAKAIQTVNELARPEYDNNYYELMRQRWRQVRRFLPHLLKTIEFQATEAGQPVLQAWHFLKSIEGVRKPDWDSAPLQIVTSPSWWRWLVDENGQFNRQAFTFCVLQALRAALRRRDLFVFPSRRWGNPGSQLLQGEAWIAAKPQVCRLLEREPTPLKELENLAAQLGEAYQRTTANFSDNAAVRINLVDGKETLVLTGLEKIEEPSSLKLLRQQVENLLPRVDLPELLLEVQALTGFASEFTHISEATARVQDLPTSICAVLLAEACNIGLEPLVRTDVPALTKDRLSWVKHNYLRQETIIKANARLVDAQTNIPLAQSWGGGEVASADGLRFQVPVRTINAGPNPKYFGVGRGITYYNFTSDQFTGFHSILIPGTLRDSLFLLEGLLEQQTSLRPTEIMTDTAGYSDIVFGLFWLLGYQFSPRLADIGEARFWRIDATANYGLLDGLAKNRINTELIAQSWEDLLRVAGSLKLGTVSASDLMYALQGGKNPSSLSKAIAELGRVAKTLYLLAYIDDEAYRRRILIQLNRGESRHSLARAVFHGQRGELRQRYREGQEDQLSALGLVVNAIVLWNTLYSDAALNHLRVTQAFVNPEDITRLSPLKYKHINMLGRYHFSLPEAVLRGEMRPLRDVGEFSAYEA